MTYRVLIPAAFLKGTALSPDARWLGCILAAFADHKTYRCWPSQPTLRRITGFSRTRLQNAIAELKGAGLLQVEPRRTGGRFGGRVFVCRFLAEGSLAGVGKTDAGSPTAGARSAELYPENHLPGQSVIPPRGKTIR